MSVREDPRGGIPSMSELLESAEAAELVARRRRITRAYGGLRRP